MGRRGNNDSHWGGSKPFLIRDGQEIYVSNDGSDNAAGSLDDPVRTIERALALAGESPKEVRIYLREGVYNIDNTINISYCADTFAPLYICAYENENAVINGGAELALSDMSAADEEFVDKIIDKPEAGKVLSISLKDAGIEDYGEISRRGHLISEEKEAQAELSLDGKVQKLAGWPNDSYTGLIKPAADSGEYGSRRNPENGCSFAVEYDRPSLWSNQSEVWLAGTLGPNYEFDYYPVSRFDSEQKRVYLREGALENYYTDPYYRFENIAEELDAPGEYYIDRQNGMLYFYPPEDAKPDSVITITMPTENLKIYEGKTPNDLIRMENCCNIVFKNLTIKGGRGSAVTGKYNTNISFINCDINSFGANGIRMDYSTGIEIRGCRIHDVGQDGIQFSNCGDYEKIGANNNIVCNCEIYNFARLERSYKAGINFGYRCVGATAARNHIWNGPHTGMIFYGVNNDIYGNEFDHLVTEFSDMDAVYANNSCFPWERGNKIHGNYFHDIGQSTMNGKHQVNVRAIRSDNNGCGLNIYGNLFVNIGDGGTGSGNNGIGAVMANGTRNKIERNVFVDCNETYMNTMTYEEVETAQDGTLYPDTVVNSSGESVDNTINGAKVSKLKEDMKKYLPVYGNCFPELKSFFYEHPKASKTNEFKDNMVINIKFPLGVLNGEPDLQGFLGSEQLVDGSGNYVSEKDPGFVSYDNGNFELLPGADKPNDSFTSIVMSAFGTIKD
ncbi:MAG: right-handed parallel beta-helix repeat-containing protein [Clostridiales bacterium]|nr:right-handed parallel beta-helix repeat-containing protein [Clostridiales bacterium]